MGWIIFGGILLLLFVLLMLPVHVTADWDEKVTVKIRYLFIRKTLYPFEEKKKTPEKKDSTEGAKKQKEKKKKHRPTLEELIDGIIDAVKRYGPGAKMILHNIRVHRLELFWRVAAEDAASCAIRYGRICAFLSAALGFFRNLMRIEKSCFRVYPDFIAEKEELRCGADLEFNPLIVIIGAVRVGAAFVKSVFSQSKGRGAKSKKKSPRPKKPLDNKAKECA